MEREYLTWNDVHQLIDELLSQLPGAYDCLLLIARGGIIPGGLLAEALGMKHILVASVEFHHDPRIGRQLPWPTFLQFPVDAVLRGRKILVVDNIWDHGRTIMTVRGRVEGAGGLPHLAVLHYKPKRSLFPDEHPDFYAAITDRWIVYPWQADHGGDMIRARPTPELT